MADNYLEYRLDDIRSGRKNETEEQIRRRVKLRREAERLEAERTKSETATSKTLNHISDESESNQPAQYQKYLESALAWAKEMGRIQLSHFRSQHLEMHSKLNNFDVVTAADKESEEYIKKVITATYPDHAILSEESGAGGTETSEWRWVIDPLDGTTNFSQGLPVFSVSIALEHKGVIVVGVVYAPYLNELFHAVKGGGAWLNGRRLSVTHKVELSAMVVATGMPYDRDRNPDNNLDNISRVCMQVRGTRRMGSAAIDLAYTAAGFYDAYWELNLNPWDVNAGILLVQEAGGVVKSIRENRNCSIVACSQKTLQVFGKLLK